MIEKLMERDYFLDANQALEMGLVDKVLTSREEQEEALEALKRSGEGKDGGKGEETPPSPAANPTPS
jgi:enoyl-CoA hydratase/carnithine racemase